MDKSPLVSIIIPVFNGEKYLSQCLNSILCSSYKNFEIVIINDGSTDDSELIAKTFKKLNPAIRYYFQSNQGVSSARNIGIDYATGEFVMFIDADDYISTDYLKNFMTSISEDSDIIIGGITKIFENKQSFIQLPYEGVHSINVILKDFAVQQKKSGVFGFVCSKIIKKSILNEKEIRFDPNLNLAEDFDFFLKYYQECKVFTIIGESGYFYRQNNSGERVDYLQQILITQKLEFFLKNKKYFNIENRDVIYKNYSDVKFAYFNELHNISIKSVKKGHEQLQNIVWLMPLDPNRKVIKKLVENRHFRLLAIYLLFRKKYVNLRRKWS